MKRILYIGAATGPASIVSALRQQGHRVFVGDPWGAQATPSANGNDSLRISLDDRSAVLGLFSHAEEVLERIDVVLLAVVLEAEFNSSGTEAAAANDWDQTIQDYLYGGFYCIQAALRKFTDKGSGQVLCLFSENAVNGAASNVGLSASSCGLLGIVSSLAAPAFNRGVNMNSLVVGSPYYLSGTILDLPEPDVREKLPYTPDPAFPILRQRALQNIEQNLGVGWAESIAAMVSHLCSDAGAPITGAMLRVANIGENQASIRWS